MSDDDHSRSSGRGPDARQVLTLAAVVLLVWFAAINSESVRISFWLSSTRAPVVVVIALSAILGGVATRLAGRRRHGGRRSAP